ncbi:MAG: glycosyltransferase [Bacillota bacterium]|nr:glycosyltransferase [Bacillota bacterium]
MHDNPLVSVIVLSYNNLKYFKQCIDSILLQDYNNIEIIVSDDCSEKFPIEYFREYIEKYKGSNIVNYKIISNEKNVGTVKNFNNAIRESNGTYIISLAIDDCFYDRNVVNSIVESFITNKCLILTGYKAVCEEGNDEPSYMEPKQSQIRLLNEGGNKLFRALCEGNFISGACTSYHRSFFEKYGYFNEEYRLLEDYPKYLKIVREGEKIYFLNIPLIKYRLGGVSTSKKPNPILAQDLALSIKKEILLHKDKIGFFIYRLKKFEYCRINKSLPMYVLCLIYLDVVFYKKLKHFFRVVGCG